MSNIQDTKNSILKERVKSEDRLEVQLKTKGEYTEAKKVHEEATVEQLLENDLLEYAKELDIINALQEAVKEAGNQYNVSIVRKILAGLEACEVGTSIRKRKHTETIETSDNISYNNEGAISSSEKKAIRAYKRELSKISKSAKRSLRTLERGKDSKGKKIGDRLYTYEQLANEHFVSPAFKATVSLKPHTKAFNSAITKVVRDNLTKIADDIHQKNM